MAGRALYIEDVGVSAAYSSPLGLPGIDIFCLSATFQLSLSELCAFSFPAFMINILLMYIVNKVSPSIVTCETPVLTLFYFEVHRAADNVVDKKNNF